MALAVSEKPVAIRITAHATPHHSDPPNAVDFYAALGMFTVAWGRFEGHFTGALWIISGLPEAADIVEPLPISWKARAALWRKAFTKLPGLSPKRDEAIAFIEDVMNLRILSRHIAAHAIWEEFDLSAPELTIAARSIKAQKGTAASLMVEVRDYTISISNLKAALNEANSLNAALVPFTNFLSSLRPLPADFRIH